MPMGDIHTCIFVAIRTVQTDLTLPWSEVGAQCYHGAGGRMVAGKKGGFQKTIHLYTG
jgi:hypothetical protein